jgi:hypothetical protein
LHISGSPYEIYKRRPGKYVMYKILKARRSVLALVLVSRVDDHSGRRRQRVD